jgi:hypothetical protein
MFIQIDEDDSLPSIHMSHKKLSNNLSERLDEIY